MFFGADGGLCGMFWAQPGGLCDMFLCGLVLPVKMHLSLRTATFDNTPSSRDAAPNSMYQSFCRQSRTCFLITEFSVHSRKLTIVRNCSEIKKSRGIYFERRSRRNRFKKCNRAIYAPDSCASSRDFPRDMRSATNFSVISWYAFRASPSKY